MDRPIRVKRAVGEQIGDWIVIGDAVMVVRPNKNRSYTLCRCVCGEEKLILTQNLGNGISTSCGCAGNLRKAAANRKHGACGTRLHRIWSAMLQRCNNPNNTNYVYYGGKGVTVCEEWRAFIPFAAWAEENGYDPRLTLDRIKSRGNYCPENCRWTTWVIQKRNTSHAKMLTAFGETKCIADWLEDPRCKVVRGTLQSRLIYGWNHEQAISTPTVDHPDTIHYRRDSEEGRQNHKEVRE